MSLQDEFAGILAKQWGSKTLNDLRYEAAVEANGTAFESIRTEGGKRLAIIVCATSRDQIAIIKRALGLQEDAPPCNWAVLTLAEMAMRTLLGQGLSYEDFHGEGGRRAAVALCATKSEPVQILETLFSFPI